MALMLATAGMATADTATGTASASDGADVVDITFAAPLTASPAVTARPDATSMRKPTYANVDAASDTIGDLAIAKFRCDCNACRVAVVQLLQTGQLSL